MLLAPTIMMAQIPKPQPNTYINDLAGVLSTSQVADLNKQIYDIEKKYSVQIAVVLVNQLPDNMVIEDYARQIGRTWHVGNAKNGLVYVASIKEHKQRLEVAQNLEGTITDAAANEILANIKPFFRNQDYSGGIKNMLSELDKRMNPAKDEQAALGAAEKAKKDQQGGDLTWLWWLLGISGGAGIILWLIFREDEDETAVPNYTSPMGRSSSYGSSRPTYITPIIVNDSFNSSPSHDYGSSSNSGSSSSDSSSSSSSSSDYGSWGSGSSDSSSSSDSGYSGGGSSSDW